MLIEYGIILIRTSDALMLLNRKLNREHWAAVAGTITLSCRDAPLVNFQSYKPLLVLSSEE
jgi:hypothetical protein